MKIHFEKANLNHKEAIFSWLNEPYIQEFWDNTQGHKDDILNFMNGRKEPSSYADGKYVYWVAKENDHPFALIMTIQETSEEDIGEIKLANLSKTGTSYGMDYMIGDKNYFGKGLGATTLSQFLEYFRSQIDPKADTFLIDPAADNPRAKHVYMKAGFEYISDFMMTGSVSGAGKLHHLLVRRFSPKVELLAASLEDYPIIENMWRYYVYDLTRYCGHKEGWECPTELSFKSDDLTPYFTEKESYVFLIRIETEYAGFVVVKKLDVMPEIDWFMSEFFIISKYQQSGIGQNIAKDIFEKFHGEWAVGVLPENTLALHFWRKIITQYSHDKLYEIKKSSAELKTADHPDPYPMIMLRFKSPPDTSINAAFTVQVIQPSKAEKICRELTSGLPEWFGILDANERYAKGCAERTSFAAMLGNNYVGMITLEFPFPNNANIYWMAVNRKYHGQNISLELLQAAERYCAKNGCDSITVETLSPKQNDLNYLKTYHFYEKNGFVPLFELNTYSPDLLMCYMIKLIKKDLT